MTNARLDVHLERVLSCPGREQERRSSCTRVIDPDWATLLGWGNPRSPILFLGLNPHYSAEARAQHAVPRGTELLTHVRGLSLEGFAHVRHFSYHRRIMNTIRASLPQQEVDEFPDELELFAFYSEVGFCPSRTGADRPSDVLNRCFRQNTLPLIDDCSFDYVVALGREASFHAVRLLVSPSEAYPLGEGPFDRFHGAVFEGGGRFVVTSYHPNARGSWDRDAVANTLLKLSRDRKVPLA